MTRKYSSVLTSPLKSPTRLMTLIAADTRNATRDPTLLFGIVITLLPTLLLPIFRDDISAWSQSSFGLVDVVGWAMPMILTVPAILIGWITGFLFLEDRDEQTLMAIDITPVGKSGFMQYRALFTATFAATITAINVVVFVPEKGLLTALFLIAMVSLLAVTVSFIFPAVARNKVEGLALTKVVNLFSLIPMIALFASPLRYLAGIFPSFWIGDILNLSTTQLLPTMATGAIGLLINVSALVIVFNWNQSRSG